MTTTSLEEAAPHLSEALGRLLREGSSDSALVTTVGEYFVQFQANRQQSLIFCEAVSNEFLASPFRISEGKVRDLEQLGFEPASLGCNFSCTISADDDATIAYLARRTVKVFREIYGCREKDQLDVYLELGREHPKNPELVEAMQAVADSGDETSWDALFYALLSGLFLVPLDGPLSQIDDVIELDDEDLYDVDDEGDLDDDPRVAAYRQELLLDEPRDIVESEGQEAKDENDQGEDDEDDEERGVILARNARGDYLLPVFTDYEAVTLLEPEGLPYFVLPGCEFFPWALENGLTQIVINPAGPISGQLSAQQVEALAAAAVQIQEDEDNDDGDDFPRLPQPELP